MVHLVHRLGAERDVEQIRNPVQFICRQSGKLGADLIELAAAEAVLARHAVAGDDLSRLPNRRYYVFHLARQRSRWSQGRQAITELRRIELCSVALDDASILKTRHPIGQAGS